MRTPFLSVSRRNRVPSLPPVDQASADNRKGALLMCAAMATFGLNDAMMKLAAQSLPLYEAIALRGGLVLVLLALVAQRNGGLDLRVSRTDALPLLLRTVGEVSSTLLFLNALHRMPIGDLSAIMQSLPLLVMLSAALFFGEKLGWRRLSAIGVGILGVALILRPGSISFDFWALVALGSVVGVVLRDIATRMFSPRVKSETIAFYAALSVTLSAFVMPSESWRVPVAGEWLAVLLAAVCLTGGYIFAVATMRVGEISFIAPFRYTSLVWAVLYGLLIFGEWPDLWTQLGAVLIVGAGLYSIWRDARSGNFSANAK